MENENTIKYEILFDQRDHALIDSDQSSVTLSRKEARAKAKKLI